MVTAYTYIGVSPVIHGEQPLNELLFLLILSLQLNVGIKATSLDFMGASGFQLWLRGIANAPG
jgi:hypothetical protein